MKYYQFKKLELVTCLDLVISNALFSEAVNDDITTTSAAAANLTWTLTRSPGLSCPEDGIISNVFIMSSRTGSD